jgi:hypothetical protein
MSVFLAPWIILAVGLAIHVFADHDAQRHTGPRLVELALMWVMVLGGITGVIAAAGHLGPWSIDAAESIGYAPGMFQWEVAFADLALGVLCIFSVLYRDRWLTAAVVAVAIAYTGFGLGHLVELSGGNDLPGNFWSIPSDVAQAALGVALLIAYRRGGGGRLPAVGAHGVAGGLAEE